MKKIIALIILLIIFGVGLYWYYSPTYIYPSRIKLDEFESRNHVAVYFDNVSTEQFDTAWLIVDAPPGTLCSHAEFVGKNGEWIFGGPAYANGEFGKEHLIHKLDDESIKEVNIKVVLYVHFYDKEYADYNKTRIRIMSRWEHMGFFRALIYRARVGL